MGRRRSLSAGTVSPGALTVGDLLAPFGEHRILFTRLLVLTIFNVSGYWDVILQMIVNAIVNAAAVVAFSYALARVLGGAFAVAAMIVCVAINAVPYGYDAILFGFHTQFFFLNAFSFASLWLLAGSKAWSPRWRQASSPPSRHISAWPLEPSPRALQPRLISCKRRAVGDGACAKRLEWRPSAR